MKNVFLGVVGGILYITLGIASVEAGSPKGKPFVAINDQIVEVSGAVSSLQDRIDALTAQVDTMEDRLIANEAAITKVIEQSAAIQTLVDNNLTTLADIEAEISYFQQVNADLRAMIEANSGDIAAHQDEIEANNALITSLQSSILMVQNGIISLETSLQEQISANTDLIAAIQDQIDTIIANLAVKQDLINGTCPDGSAVQQVYPDGSVVCGTAGGGAVSGQLEAIRVWTNSSNEYGHNPTPPGRGATVWTFCPTGYTTMGCGINTASGWNINRINTAQQSADDPAFCIVQGINNNPYGAYLTGIATCSRIAP